MDGALFDKIVEGTGLPRDLVSREFLKRIQARGLDKTSLDIDQIREVLADFLQDVILKVKDEFQE